MLILFLLLAPTLLLSIYVLAPTRREFKRQDKLSPATSSLVRRAYLLHASSVGLSAYRPLWPVPLARMWALTVGALIVAGIELLRSGRSSLPLAGAHSGMREDMLVTSGVNRFSRNPQNAGWLLLFGVSVLGRSLAGLLLTALFWLALHTYLTAVEEPHLRRTFGYL